MRNGAEDTRGAIHLPARRAPWIAAAAVDQPRLYGRWEPDVRSGVAGRRRKSKAVL